MLLPALAMAAAAVVLAGIVAMVQHAAGGPAERGILLTGVLYAALLAGAPAVYVARRGRGADPATAGAIALGTCALLLAATYLFWVSAYVRFPADILIWSEGDYVNDMLKFSVGYPIFSPQVNNDSFTYVPGSQLLTYFLAWITGTANSIPAYRAIQLCYTAAAALVACFCCRRVLALAGVLGRIRYPGAWAAMWAAILFLVATNSITDRFAHNLHGDALAQLFSMAAFYLLLSYAETRSRRVLFGMALLPGMGFFVRQSLLVWAPLYIAYLVLFDRPRSLRRAATFAAATSAAAGLVIGGCYLAWGNPFVYWVFRVLGAHAVSPLRSFQHVLDAWAYFAAGLLGGAALVRGRKAWALLGAWLLSLALLASEAYTSGVAWMLNHMGPGSLLAGVWFVAALTAVWGRMREWLEERETPAGRWAAAGACSAAAALLFSGLGVVRIPMRPLPDDAYRYVREIEAQFRGRPASDVLLDAGTWMYLKPRVIMKDRAPSIGERGYSQTGDFSGILGRIEHKRYARILVRDFHQPDFWYDYYLWPKPSGIRQALLANYREVGRIRGVESPVPPRNRAEDPYLFGEITILEPKPEAVPERQSSTVKEVHG